MERCRTAPRRGVAASLWIDAPETALPFARRRRRTRKVFMTRLLFSTAAAACAALSLFSGPAAAFKQTGVGSYYGPELHGRRTASGERFNQAALTAAHRTAPFGSRLKVTNLSNGRSVVVRVNDRGPFVRGRVVDVSAGAARQLGMHGRGIAKVRVEKQ
jgi:rare lipoprotein A